MSSQNTKPVEFKNFLEFAKLEKFPQFFIYSSKDSYEFDIITDLYKEKFTGSALEYETIVYVSEPGDSDRFFSEIFNLSMFSQNKLFIIKSAQTFFKPVLAMKKEQLEQLNLNIQNITNTYIILIHFDSGEIPQKIKTLFASNSGFLKSSSYFPNETRQALESILSDEKITFDNDAIDEFIFKIPPSHGAYLKNIKKLNLYLNKKHYTVNDINEIFSNQTEMNSSVLVDMIFQNREFEFFRELSKFNQNADTLLLFLAILLNRTNDLRKYRIISRQKSLDETFLIEMLGMQSFSPKRQRFILSRFEKESRAFPDVAIDLLYEILLDISIKSKINSNKQELMLYFVMKMTKFFNVVSSRNR